MRTTLSGSWWCFEIKARTTRKRGFAINRRQLAAHGGKARHRGECSPKTIHGAHLRKADFDKHGNTYRCQGVQPFCEVCTVQPHTPECRQRLGGTTARIRMQERTAEVKASEGGHGGSGDRKRLEGIENQAMVEEDPEKLANLCGEYGRSIAQGRELTTTMTARRMVGPFFRKGPLDRSRWPCTRTLTVEMWRTETTGNVGRRRKRKRTRSTLGTT